MTPLFHLVCGSTGAGKTTYALKLAADLGAVHFSIDDWMVRLFGPDQPARPDWAWITARLARCEAQMLDAARQLAALGISSILDLGLQQAAQRRRVADAARAAAIGVRLHVIDVPAAERWRRVEQRNSARGDTFRLTVTRPMFEAIEALWQLPDAAEMLELNGVRIAPA